MEESTRSDPEQASRSAVLRKAGLAVLAVVTLAAVGYLAVGLLLHAITDPDRLAGWTEQRLEASLNRNVEVGSVGLGVFPRLEVDLRDLRVDNPPGFEAPPFAEVERVRLGVALFPLLRRRVEIDDASVSGAAVRLRVLQDERSNFGDFVPDDREEEAPEAPSDFQAEVGRLAVDGVTVSYRNDATGLRAEARDVSGDGTMGDASGEGTPVEVHLEAAGLSASGLPGGRSLEPRAGGVRIRGETDDAFGRLRIGEGEVRLGPVGVGLEGRVDSLRSSVRRVQLRLVAESLDLGDLMDLAESFGPPPDAGGRSTAGGDATAAWDSLRPTGTVGLDLDIRGDLGADRRPVVEGVATFRDGAYGAPGRPDLAEELAGEVRIGTDSLRLEGLRGRLLDGDVEASGAVAVDSPRGYRLALTGTPRLEAWPRSVPGAAPTADVSGPVDLDLTVRGRPGETAGIRATGSARPSGVRFRRDGWNGDLVLPGGSLALTGDGIAGTGLPVVAAGDTLRADLELEGLFSTRDRAGAVPSLSSELRGPRVDLDALLGREADDSVTYGRLAFARLGGRNVAGRAPEELAGVEGLHRPESLPVEGTVRAVLGRVIWGPYRLDDVEVEVRLAPDRLEITRGALSTFGGRAEGTFSLDLGPEPTTPFSLEWSLDGVEAADFLSTLTPMGSLTTGAASLSFATAGRLDTLLLPVAADLSGDGRMEVTDGRLRENPVTSALARTLSQPALSAPGFQRWTLPFEVRGDSLHLPRGQLTGGPLPVDLAGRVSYGGGMELAATVQLPREAASSLAGRVGGLPSALLNRVARGEGPLPVGLGLSGTLMEPQVRVEVDALRQTLESAARQETTEEVERRARGLLESILGDRADTARADTAAADTVPADTAGARPDSTGELSRVWFPAPEAGRSGTSSDAPWAAVGRRLRRSPRTSTAPAPIPSAAAR